jgi:hypothetical protein
MGLVVLPRFPRFTGVKDFFDSFGTPFAKPYFVRDWLTHREMRFVSE